MRTGKSVAAAILAVALAACRGGAKVEDGGHVVVQVDAVTSAGDVTRVEVDIQPANVTRTLARDASTGGFTGVIALPPGDQTLTARAYVGTTQVGSGTATARIVLDTTSVVLLTIFDGTGPAAHADRTPIIGTLVASSTTAYLGDAVSLSATAVDPDGDTLAYQWTQSCTDGVFSSPTAPSTQWSSLVEGSCTLTVTATANGQSRSRSVPVTVRPHSTAADVRAQFVPNPVFTSMTAAVAGGTPVTRLRSDSDVLVGTVYPGQRVAIGLAYDLETSYAGAVSAWGASSCGGTVDALAFDRTIGTLAWTVPSTAGVCLVSGYVGHEQLWDTMLLGFVVEPCTADAQCGGTDVCLAGTCGPDQTVSGSRLVTYWERGAPTATVPAPALSAVQAIPVLATGDYDAPRDARVLPDGSFTIAGIAPGTRYLLALTDAAGATTFIDTSARSVDLGRDEVGRSDKALPTLPTVALLDLANLDPWAVDDEIQVTASGADVWEVPSYAWTLADGDVSVAAQPMDFLNSALGRPTHLVDVTHGDVAFVHQLTSQQPPDPLAPSVSYRTATKAAKLPLVVADGATVAATATLVPVPQSGRADTTWQATAFEAQLPAMSPAAVNPRHALYLDAAQGPLAFPAPQSTAGTPDLLSLSMTAPASDLALSQYPYGQFLPSDWSEFVDASMQAVVRFTAPGATRSRSVVALVSVRYPLPAPRVLAPAVTPVRAVAVGGIPATAAVAGVGTTPVIGWLPPAVGRPDRYIVTVFGVSTPDGVTTSFTRVATLLTAGTQVRLPPGLLDAGGTYFVRITAWAEPGSDVAARPFRAGYTVERADTVTSTFTP